MKPRPKRSPVSAPHATGERAPGPDLLFVHAGVGLSRLALDGTFTAVNPALCRLLGRSADELLGLSVRDVTHPDDFPASVAALERVIRSGQGVSVDKRYLRRDGTMLWANSLLTRVDDAHGTPLAVVATTTDLTAHQQAADARLEAVNRALRGEIAERQRAEDDRQELLRRLVTAQEEERRRISRELHDQFGQHIAAILLGLKSLDTPTRGNPAETLHALQALTAKLGEEIHQLAFELRPTALDDLGLRRALTHYAEHWSAQSGIPIELHLAGDPEERLPGAIETTAYRIVQEALKNVQQHSGATRAALIVERRPDQLALIVEDDGRGFDPSHRLLAPTRRLGLVGMMERAATVGGEVKIESGAGEGTTVFVRLPLKSNPEERADG